MAATSALDKKCCHFLWICAVVCAGSVIAENLQIQEKKIHEQTNLVYDFFNIINNLSLQPTNVNVSEACSYQLKEIASAVDRNEMWALQITDAWARVPSGILYGHLMEMGNFDECLAVEAQLNSENWLQGKYCLSILPLEKPFTEQLQLGVCIPKVCDAIEFNALFKIFLQTKFNMNLNDATFGVVNNDLTCKTNEHVELEVLDWVTVGILIALAAIMALSTSYDYLYSYKGREVHTLLASFSIRKNMRQLLKIQQGHISCLHGIRCLSLFWIIFLHCYLYRILSPNINAIEIENWEQTPFSMIDQSGSIAVDSFFFLSGLLIVMVAFKELEKSGGKLNVPIMYIHRYFRLTPVLALAVLIYMTVFRYLGDGPIWNMFTSANRFCYDSWWTTLLYVQNYAAANNLCLGHAWYLAVDTQFYFFSPIFLLIMWKWGRKGIAAIVIFGLLMVACLFTIVMINHYTMFDIARNHGSASEAMPKIYYSTHSRTSPWIIGLLFGYYLHRNNGRIAKLATWLVLVGWTVAVTLSLTVVFSWYPKTLVESGGPTTLETAFYLALGRVAWPLALCWVVYACMNGYGGPVNIFLSWNFWQPLSKLSYCMYIWHLLVITVNAARIKTNTYFSDYDVMLDFWHNFGITLLVSTCMYLAIEAPILDIEKFLLPRNKPKSEKSPPIPATTISQQNLCD